MNITSIFDKSFDAISTVSLVIEKTGQDQYHTGILYKDIDNNPKVLHLEWHKILSNSIPKDDYLWIELKINPIRSRQISAMCRLILEENKKNSIPYGFSSPKNTFNTLTGEYIVNGFNIGLTCASFVLATLNATGLDLIKYETWPESTTESIKWQEKVIEWLRKTGVENGHIEKVQNELGNVRYIPTEVFASSKNAGKPPMEYNEAKILSKLVISKLDDWVSETSK